MKVLLVLPTMNRFLVRQKAASSPLGLLAIASYIKAKGHIVKIVDLTVKTENIKKHIRSFEPDVVGLSVMSALAGNSAIKVSKAVKEFNKIVVWGGRLPSSLPELCLKESCVDFAVIGEGEITFSELLHTIETGEPFNNIAGLAFADENGLHINKDREFADLAAFPVLDWSIVNPKKYAQKYFLCEKMMYSYFSKGCPGKCTYCFNPSYHRSVHRKRPPEHVIEEIEYLVKNYGIDGIYFADEFWYPGKDDMQTFFRLIEERNLKFVWGCQSRLGTFSREDFQHMFDTGCRWILFGVESGCEKRNKETKKNIDIKGAKETFDICREVGIITQSSFIIGYPGETEEELKQTVTYAFSLEADLLPLNGFYPQPDSDLYNEIVSSKLFTPPKSIKEWSKIEVGEVNKANISKVPSKDLKVLHFYTQWLGFSQNGSISWESYTIAKKMAIDALKDIAKLGPIFFFIGALVRARNFLTVFWYANAYPKILKKYGIDKKK